MENKQLQFLKLIIDKEIEEHPVPVSQWLNGILKKVSLGEVEISYLARPEMNNGNGMVQGGILASMIDHAIAVAIYSLGENLNISTITFNLEYHYPVWINGQVLVHAKVIKKGRSVIFTESTIVDLEGKILTKATSTLAVKS